MAAALFVAGPLDSRQRVALEPYSVYVFETRTGRVVDRVPYVGVPRWSSGINQASAGWSVTVPLRGHAQGAGMDPETLDALADPWRFSWAITQGSQIWQAGPVVNESYQGGSTSTVSGGGLWKLLSDKRLLINPDRANVATVGGTDADIAFGTGTVSEIGSPIPAANRNLSLHTIAKRLVSIIEGANGGNLPVVFPDDIAGTAVRTYPGYDLASPGQRLQELAQVIDGPELEFTPEFVDPTSRQAVQWRMRIGNPRLGNLGFAHQWIAGRALCSASREIDGSNRVTRDFERGNGMNRDLIIGFHNVPVNALDNADILLEEVGNDHASTTDVEVLNDWARSSTAANVDQTQTFGFRVRTAGDDGHGNRTNSPHMAEVLNGDNGMFIVRDNPRIPDGTYAARIIGRQTGNTAHEIELITQFLAKVA
jgi:hypothetical protein